MKLLFSLLLSCFGGLAIAQWNANGTHINSTNSGNVGIGSNLTTPGEKLHVAGNIQIGETASYSSSTYYINMPGSSGTVNGGNGRELVISAGSSDNAANARGGHLILRPGVPVSPSTTYGNVALADNGGKVGIGTTSPLAYLDVAPNLDVTTGPGKVGTVLGRLQEGQSVGGGTFLGVRGYATSFAFSGKSFALEHNFYGFTNSSINFYRGEGITGGFLTFHTDTDIERMRISTDGNVGIGTTNPDEKLTVNGTIHSKEVRVDLTFPAPDYVFEQTYKLRTLAEVESYVNENKHLPEVPSAKEMERNGVNVSEMNMLLLKKVEELTLYVIELKKEVSALKNQEK